VFEWCTHFRSRHQSVGDDDRAGVPHSAVMAGAILVDIVPSRSTVNARLLQYTTPRPVMWPAIRQKRPNLLRKGVILQHGNASPHRARHTVEKVAVMGWQLLQHPLYIPDLAPSDFQPVGPLKESLGGLKFEDDQQPVLKFFHTTDKDFCATGFRRLVEHWGRC